LSLKKFSLQIICLCHFPKILNQRIIFTVRFLKVAAMS